MKTKGIVILALGHPFYGRMAFNLAVSIKQVDPSVPIALFFSGDALKELFRYDLGRYLDFMMPVSKDVYMRNENVEYLRAKTYLYELSPYDETIFLDADTIWLPRKKASALFAQLSAAPLWFQNRGSVDLSKNKIPSGTSLWVDVNKVKEAYNFKKGRFMDLYSEFIYFKKTAKNEALFATAREVYDNLLVECFAFNGAIPDELPFAIAMTLTGVYPMENFIPVYWEHTEKKKMETRVEELYNSYWAYSIGGKFAEKRMKEFYDNLAKFYFNKEGLQYPYQLINKKDFIPERSKL